MRKKTTQNHVGPLMSHCCDCSYMRMKAKSIVNCNTKINTLGYSFQVITKKRLAVTRERTVTDTKMFTLDTENLSCHMSDQFSNNFSLSCRASYSSCESTVAYN
jgi:hypothetical protein